MIAACGVGELATREGSRRGVIDLTILAKKPGAAEVPTTTRNLRQFKTGFRRGVVFTTAGDAAVGTWVPRASKEARL